MVPIGVVAELMHFIIQFLGTLYLTLLVRNPWPSHLFPCDETVLGDLLQQAIARHRGIP